VARGKKKPSAVQRGIREKTGKVAKKSGSGEKAGGLRKKKKKKVQGKKGGSEAEFHTPTEKGITPLQMKVGRPGGKKRKGP